LSEIFFQDFDVIWQEFCFGRKIPYGTKEYFT